MNGNQSQSSKVCISGLFIAFVLGLSPASGGSQDVGKLAQAIESSEKARLKLLSSSKGHVSLEIYLYERVPNDSTKTPAMMVHDLGPDSREYIPHSQIKWDVSWYQKDLKRRFDTHITSATSPTLSASPIHRATTLEGNHKIMDYDVTGKKATLRKWHQSAASNPSACFSEFDITRFYCPAGRDTVASIFKSWADSAPCVLSDEMVEGVPCIKAQFSQNKQTGSQFKRRLEYWISPEKSYSAVKMRYYTARHNDKFNPIFGYDATYTQAKRHNDVWLLKTVKKTFSSNASLGTQLETLCATFNDQEVGVDISDAVFAKEALGLAPDTEIMDKTNERREPTR
ncbi:MAG: hypothetical protein K9N55_16555 [Phycisphaerae bacterium]|nr:hypothetical protein [Phycisphaerae bacterium]